MLSVIHPISLSEQVVEQVRTAIIEGHLKPGDRITEAMLTEMLGISRTPIREALILLVREGLIVSAPNRATFVRAFTSADVMEIFTFRTALENFAGGLAMANPVTPSDVQYLRGSIAAQQTALASNDLKTVRSTDMAFHEYLVMRSGHAILLRNWREIVAQIAAVLYLRAEAIRDYDETQSIRDHSAIVDAYEARDIERLQTLNQQINQRVAAECIRAVQTSSPPDVPSRRKRNT